MINNQPGWIPGDSPVSVGALHFQFTLPVTALAFMPLKQGSDSHSFKWFSSVPLASKAFPEH